MSDISRAMSGIEPKLTVGICGGGIAGLATAAFLSKSGDIETYVFEAKPEIRAIGAGIAVWKRYWDVLQKLGGFDSACSRRGLGYPKWSEVSGPVLRKSDNPLHAMDFTNLELGPRLLPRDALLDILHQKIDPERCHIQTNKKLEHWLRHESSKLKLFFQDGTSTLVDLLIGADGVHSRVRSEMFKGYRVFAEPEFSGQLAYRMSCPKEEVIKINPNHEALRGFKIWCGDGRHVTSNSVRGVIQITAYDNIFDENGRPMPFDGPWVVEVSSEEVACHYQGWEPDIVSLLRASKSASRWAIHVVHPLPYFIKENVCLIGDAAHAMTPHQGLGGGQGIEDAYILAGLLTHPLCTPSTLHETLRVYDDIRRPFSQEVARQSYKNGLMYAFLRENVRNASLHIIGEEMKASCRWLVEGDNVEMEWRKAESVLVARLTNPAARGKV